MNGRVKMYYGDTSGWLYSFNEHKDTDSYDPTTLDFPIGFWVPELNLASEVRRFVFEDLCKKVLLTSRADILDMHLRFKVHRNLIWPVV